MFTKNHTTQNRNKLTSLFKNHEMRKTQTRADFFFFLKNKS